MLNKINKKDDKNITFGESLISGRHDISITTENQINDTKSYPYFTVKEIAEKAITDRGSNNYTYARLEFFNLDSIPNISKIFIYYSLGPTIMPKNPNLLWLQTNSKLGEIDLLAPSVDLSQEFRLLLTNEPITQYSFFAIYKDSSNNVIMINNHLLFNAVINVVFSGLSFKETILGVKNLTIDYTTNLIDQDNFGYEQPLEINVDYITLNWLDLSKLKNTTEYNKYTNISKFYDTFGKEYSLSPNHFQDIDYYIAYLYVATNNQKPENLFPLHVNPIEGLIPKLADKNGSWTLLAQTKTNSIVVKVPENKFIGLWVGFKLK